MRQVPKAYDFNLAESAPVIINEIASCSPLNENENNRKAKANSFALKPEM
jgi:hypothetical protein